MHYLQISLHLAVVFSGAPADPDAALKKHQPPDVVALIDRIVDCNHWLGEPPYDAARAKEIEAAISELRCAQLQQDEQALLAKYADNPAVRAAFKAAHDIVR